MAENNKPKILIIGTIFFANKGTTFQGELIYRKFKAAGYDVHVKSKIRKRIPRLLDIVFFLLSKRKKYDVVILKTYGGLSFILEDIVSFILKYVVRKPFVFFIQGGAMIDFFNRNQAWCTKVLNRGTEILSPSPEIVQFLKRKEFNKVFQHPNGIELQKFPYSREYVIPETILWVRGFHEIYNPQLAIMMMGEVIKEFPNAKLTMIGPDKGLRAEIEELIFNQNLDSNIDIIGPVANTELYKYYQSHQVYINTTRYESFGLSMFEAASCGIPMVSTGVGAIPFLWQNQTNILLADDKPENFALAVITFFRDLGLAQKVSEKGLENAKKYSWEEVEKMWIDKFYYITSNNI